MRTSVLLVLLVLSVGAMANESQFRSKLTSLLNMKTKAVDAVESALGLLRDLKQANVDSQANADEVNRTQETQLGKQISDLTWIADQNKAVGDESTAHRKHIESEIQVTAEYLAWINNRRNDINKKRETLREHRCYANFMFIKALKEHDEALEVVRFLREDIASIVNGGSNVDLAQIKDSASKLEAYAHLFNTQALKEFSQLTQAEDVDAATGNWDDRATDNSQDALSLEH